MRKGRILLCFTLVLAVLLGAAACKKNVPQDALVPTGEKILSQNTSAYRVLLPEKADREEELAAEELVTVFYQATGYTLPVETDDAFISGGKYLSVGKTKLLAESGIVLSAEELQTSGHRVVTKGGSVIMAGYKSEGTIYAVYTFLEKTFGMTIYAYDEIFVERKTEVDLLNFDLTVIPDIMRRSIGYKYLWNGDSLKRTRRLRLTLPEEGMSVFGHTVIGNVLPKEKYGKEHPDWYSVPGESGRDGQLNLANSEMRREFIEQSKRIIEAAPEDDYYMIGMEDNSDYCDCADCRALTEKNGGFRSANFIQFTNEVASALDAWMAEKDPNRRLYYIIYAYFHHEAAPVREENGKYVPYNDSVIPNDNVVVMYAPLEGDFTYAFNDTRNSVINKTLEQWSAVTNNIYMYSYCVNFRSLFNPIDIFSTRGGSFQFAAEKKFFGFYEQGATTTVTPNMEDLRMYVMSRMMWDTSLNADTLALDFIDHYYGPAAATFKNYYRSLRQWYIYQVTELKLKINVMDYNYGSSVYWPKYMLDQWNKMFLTMFEELKAIEGAAPMRYQTYFDRLNREYMSILYTYCSLYKKDFSSVSYNGMLDTLERYCNQYGIVHYGENASLAEQIANWRT